MHLSERKVYAHVALPVPLKHGLRSTVGENLASAREAQESTPNQVGRIPWRRAWPPTPVLLPGESHGQRSLAGYSLWVAKSQTTEQLSLFNLS